ncbi:MAG: hypothetical protein ACFFD4_20785 [Candidatus Odinarchaeota archaeon]
MQKKQVNETDIAVSKYLSGIERKYPKLQKAKLVETIPMVDLVILVIDNKMEDFLKSMPKVQEELEALLGKRLAMIVKAKTLKTTLNSIFAPLEIEGLDTIYLPTVDDQEELKLRLRGDVEQLEMPIETLKEIAARITGKLIMIQIIESDSDSEKDRPARLLY